MTRDGSGYWIGTVAEAAAHDGQSPIFGDGCQSWQELYPNNWREMSGGAVDGQRDVRKD